MRLSILAFWVLGLIAVIHYSLFGRVDLTSFFSGAIGVAMTLVISWDSRVEEWEDET